MRFPRFTTHHGFPPAPTPCLRPSLSSTTYNPYRIQSQTQSLPQMHFIPSATQRPSQLTRPMHLSIYCRVSLFAPSFWVNVVHILSSFSFSSSSALLNRALFSRRYVGFIAGSLGGSTPVLFSLPCLLSFLSLFHSLIPDSVSFYLSLRFPLQAPPF